MFEILTFVLDTLKTVIPAALTSQTKHARQTAASTIFDLYTHLNRCIERGYQITAELRLMISRVGANDVNGEPMTSKSLGMVPHLVDLQHRELRDVFDDFKLVSRYAVLIGPNRDLLRTLAWGKRDVVDMLRGWVSTGTYPAIARNPDGQLERLGHTLDTRDFSDKFSRSSREQYQLINFDHRITTDNVDEMRTIVDALDIQLDELAAAAENLRQTILQSFTLDEVLVAAARREKPAEDESS